MASQVPAPFCQGIQERLQEFKPVDRTVEMI